MSKTKNKIKWGNRLKERARESLGSPFVWWVHQKEAEAKIRKIENRMRAAERLLEHIIDWSRVDPLTPLSVSIKAHLEAARKNNSSNNKNEKTNQKRATNHEKQPIKKVSKILN